MTNTPNVPCPREVWRHAGEDARITVTVNPEDADGTVEFAGHITQSPEKHGDAWTTTISVTLTPYGELAPLQLEARKERGEWGPFRAFHWTHPPLPDGPEDHVFRYVGRVVALNIEAGASDESAGERAEVTA